MDIFFRYRKDLAAAMKSLLAGPSSPLLDMARYHLGLADLGGQPTSTPAGKMLRPALCMALGEALGGNVHQCLPAALSLELVHRTSLIFDDIQDRSPQRNHQPTVWGVWGVEQAINVGLMLSSYTRLALYEMAGRGVAPGTILEVHRLLEETVTLLCQGQYLDIRFQNCFPSLEEYFEMVRLKTGVLLGTACQIGALVAGAAEPVQDACKEFGESLGTLFQLQDDYLGVWGEEARLGKMPSDLEERKRGLPVVLALNQDSRVKPLLASSEADVQATADLYQLLEELGVREHSETLIQATAREARLALRHLPLSPESMTEFDSLVDFVAFRAN